MKTNHTKKNELVIEDLKTRLLKTKKILNIINKEEFNKDFEDLYIFYDLGVKKLRELYMNEGLVVCENCLGRMFINSHECPYCKGAGYTDWVNYARNGGKFEYTNNQPDRFKNYFASILRDMRRNK